MAGESRRLAERFRDQRQRYVDGKGPIVWKLLAEADDWAQRTRWSAGASDG